MAAVTWFVWCPQLVQDDGGHLVRCKVSAEVVHSYDLPSTSGPVLHVVTQCIRHRVTVLWEDLELVV